MTAAAAPGTPLESALRARRDAGGKALVPYVMAGITPDWTDHVAACVDAGADAVEVGLPFSDPMLDGPTIQQAATRALERGASIDGLLADLDRLPTTVPIVVMTYSNIVRRRGNAEFCRRLADVGVSGLIVPDTPLAEAGPLSAAAEAAPLELVLLLAPSTPPGRAAAIGRASRGFVYAVSIMGVTGQRDHLSTSVSTTVDSVRRSTTLPVLVGFGISTPHQAVEAAQLADGVIVASTLMDDVLHGHSPADLHRRVSTFRDALDTDLGAVGAVPGGGMS